MPAEPDRRMELGSGEGVLRVTLLGEDGAHYHRVDLAPGDERTLAAPPGRLRLRATVLGGTDRPERLVELTADRPHRERW